MVWFCLLGLSLMQRKPHAVKFQQRQTGIRIFCSHLSLIPELQPPISQFRTFHIV